MKAQAAANEAVVKLSSLAAFLVEEHTGPAKAAKAAKARGRGAAAAIEAAVVARMKPAIDAAVGRERKEMAGTERLQAAVRDLRRPSC